MGLWLAVLTLSVFGGEGEAADAPSSPAETARFADVTESSGVGGAVQEHYAQVPDWWLSGMALIDLDGDGDLDLHLAGHGFPAAAAENDGRGRLRYVDPRLSVPRGVRAQDDLPYPGGEIRLAHDFDEDGRLDLLASWHDGGGAFYRNDSRPGAWNFRRPGALDWFNRASAMADIDGDGRIDYLRHAGGRERTLAIHFGRPDGSFAPEAFEWESLAETCPIPVDLDGDGRLDFLLSSRGYNPPGRRILRCEGRLQYRNVTAESGLDPDAGSIHGAGDLNRDGQLDLICIEDDAVVVYLNDGRGRFTRKADAVAGLASLRSGQRPRSANWGGAVVTDFDNDGRADVIVNGRYFLYVLQGAGDGTLRLANPAWGLPMTAWSAVDEGICFGDIDGDGDLDLVLCHPETSGRKKSVLVFRNDHPPRGWLRVRLVGRPGNRAAAGAKIRIHEPGGLDDAEKLVCFEQVAIWGRQSFHSYYAQSLTERHFGLGDRGTADVSVEFHPSGKRVERKAVPAGTTVEIAEP